MVKVKQKVYCQNCGFFKSFALVSREQRKEKHCSVCAEWKHIAPPAALVKEIQNAECYKVLNAQNNCAFYTELTVSKSKLNRTRVLYKLKKSK